jgi:hypothetical protein
MGVKRISSSRRRSIYEEDLNLRADSCFSGCSTLQHKCIWLMQHGAPSHAKAFIQKLHDCYSSYTRCFSLYQYLVLCITIHKCNIRLQVWSARVGGEYPGKDIAYKRFEGKIQTVSVLWVPCVMLMFIHIVTLRFVTGCSVVDGYQRSARTHCPHLHGSVKMRAVPSSETTALTHLITLYQNSKDHHNVWAL